MNFALLPSLSICMCWKMVVKNQEEMESKMDGLAGAAGGCSCDKVLQIIARTRLDARRAAAGACQRHDIDSAVICPVTLLPASALSLSWSSRGRITQMPLNGVIWRSETCKHTCTSLMGRQATCLKPQYACILHYSCRAHAPPGWT